MPGRVAHAAVRAFLRVWFSSSASSWRMMPRPSGAPIVHAAGVHSDRLLLLGAGLAVGYGAMSYDLAFAGNLARRLSAVTGRGTDIEIIADPDMTVAGSRSAIAGVNLSRFDAVILTLGAVEALELMPRRRWRKHLQELFDSIAGSAPSSLQVFVIGVPQLSSLLPLPGLLKKLAGVQSAAFNEESRRLCAELDHITFVPFDPRTGDFIAGVGRALYDQWAAMIARPIAAKLDADAPDPVGSVDEAARQRALESVRILDTPPDPRFDQVVSNARDLFDVSGASITFIDGDHQWHKAAVGNADIHARRVDSPAGATIQRAGVLVVPDLLEDDRFRDKPWAAGPRGIRFFAGYPIEAPEGYRIGALCVVDDRPRVFSDRDAVLLRQLALRVDALLWGAAASDVNPRLPRAPRE